MCDYSGHYLQFTIGNCYCKFTSRINAVAKKINTLYWCHLLLFEGTHEWNSYVALKRFIWDVLLIAIQISSLDFPRTNSSFMIRILSKLNIDHILWENVQEQPGSYSGGKWPTRRDLGNCHIKHIKIVTIIRYSHTTKKHALTIALATVTM